MSDQPLQEADCRLRVARAIWLAMVNDEAPDDETLNREGYLDAADAVLGLLVPRSEAEAAELLALRLYDLMRDDDAEHMTEDDVESILRLRDVHPRDETP